MQNKKLRILQVIDTYYPNFDGPNQVATYCSKSLIKLGLDVELAASYFPNYKDSQPFEVFRVKSVKSEEGNRAALPFWDGKLKRFLRQNKFDLIHIHSPFTMCGFFTKYGKKHNIPTVFTFHTKFRDEFERMLKFKPLQRFMMHYIMKNINRSDFVLTVSNGAKDCLVEYGYRKYINVIRNGTDLTCPVHRKTMGAGL